MRKEEMAKEMDPEKLKVGAPLTQGDYYACGASLWDEPVEGAV